MAAGHNAHEAGGKERMQANIVRRMHAIDPEAAHVTVLAWVKFLNAGSGRRHKLFTRIDDYLPYRIADIGES